MGRIFWFLISLTFLVDAAGAQNRLAFVSGIDRYDKIDGLTKAVNDAKGIAKSLDALGYKVSLSPDIGRLDFKGKWEAFLRSVNPGDDVVFFFAGHGVELQGVNFLLPKDTPEMAQGEEILRAWGMNFKTLKQQLDERKPRLTIYIVDACRDNPYKGTRAPSSRVGVTVQKVEGAFILYSAGDNEQALDWLFENDPNPNSVFTRRLLPLLGTRGLRLDRMAERLSAEVADDALNKYKLRGKHVPHRQRPAFYNGLSGEFCFAGCTSQEAAQTLASQKSEAAEVWTTINQTTSPAVLKTYIARFKGTFYADLAQARLDEIGTTVAATDLASPRPGRRGGESETDTGGPLVGDRPKRAEVSGHRYAFLAGMNSYIHTSKLQGSGEDTKAIGAKLAELGYRNQFVLDLGRRDFLVEWSRFLDQLSPSSEALIYYNGHGLQIEGENYLVPIDADVKDKSGVTDLISLSFLLELIRDKRPRGTLAVLDSCRDNPFLTSGTRGFQPVGLAPIDNPVGTFVMSLLARASAGWTLSLARNTVPSQQPC